MIPTFVRIAATPLAMFLDHVMVPRRTYEFFDLSGEFTCDSNSNQGIEVAR